MTKTIIGDKNNTAMFEGVPMLMVARWGRNGIKYVWLYPSQRKLDELISRHGVDQVDTGIIKEEGKIISVDCLWLEY